MVTLRKLLVPLSFALVVVGLLAWLSVGGDRTDARGEPARDAVETAPAKDPREKASKEASSRETSRVISLVEAIGIAEKVGKGQAVRAERRDRPELGFRIEVVGPDGSKIRIELTADGKVKEKKEDEHRTPEKKSAGK